MNPILFSGGLLTMLQGKGVDGIGRNMHVVSVGPLTDGSPDTCSCDELVDTILEFFLVVLFSSSLFQLRNTSRNALK